jgi:hypothetical protein
MDYVVELDFDGPGFVAVPNAVVDDKRLGPEALGVLVYLARLAGGRGPRVVRVSAICSRFQFGKEKWQRIARELRAAGALSDNFGSRTADGRHIVRSLAVGWPKPEKPAVVCPSRAVKARVCEPGNPADRRKTCEPGNPADRAGNPAEVGRVSRLLKEEQTEPRAAAAPSGRQAAARGSGGDSAKSDDAVQRAAVSRSLGLPWFDPASGEWRKAGQEACERASGNGGA